MNNDRRTSKNSGRVLFITPQPFLTDRGSPLRVKSEIESLHSLGYEIDLLCFPFGSDFNHKGITLHRSAKIPGIKEPAVGPSWQKIMLDVPLGLKGLMMGLKNDYQVIHGVEEAAFIAAFAACIKKTPFIADMHSLLPDQLRYSGFLSGSFFIKSAFATYNWCLKNSSGIVAVCRDVQEYASRVAPNVPCAQIEDLPLDSSWEEDPETKQTLIDRYSLQGKRVLAYTGNFGSYQGIPLLLEAFSRSLSLMNTPESTRLMLVGESNTELVKEVQNLVRNLELEDKVIFTGELPSSMMGSVMGISDAVISPRTRGSNTPLKLYCYMASGKPVVATSILSHTQVLHEDAAYLAEPNPEALGAAISKALETNPDALKRHEAKAQAAKKILDERFNKTSFTKSMGWLYERATNAPLPNSLPQLKNERKNPLVIY